MRKLLLLLLLVAAPLAAQYPIVGVRPGLDSFIVTIPVNAGQNAATLRKAVPIIVIFGQPVALHFWREARVVNGQRVLIPLDSLPVEVGGYYCTYTTATTVNGVEVPGIPTAPVDPRQYHSGIPRAVGAHLPFGNGAVSADSTQPAVQRANHTTVATHTETVRV